MALDIDKVREIAERVAASAGLEVVEVELRGGGKARMLRIVIDKPGGVTHEDCAALSREVGTILDVEDAVPGDHTFWRFLLRAWTANCFGRQITNASRAAG